jgi:hypothetical protein
MSQRQIVGPLFFEETINAEQYQNFLTQFVSMLQENEKDCSFQHDAATAHNVNKTALLQ